MFHSYVSLPEGTTLHLVCVFPVQLPWTFDQLSDDVPPCGEPSEYPIYLVNQHFPRWKRPLWECPVYPMFRRHISRAAPLSFSTQPVSAARWKEHLVSRVFIQALNVYLQPWAESIERNHKQLERWMWVFVNPVYIDKNDMKPTIYIYIVIGSTLVATRPPVEAAARWFSNKLPHGESLGYAGWKAEGEAATAKRLTTTWARSRPPLYGTKSLPQPTHPVLPQPKAARGITTRWSWPLLVTLAGTVRKWTSTSAIHSHS